MGGNVAATVASPLNSRKKSEVYEIMKISEVLPILQNDLNVRVIFEEGAEQIVYQGTASGLSKQTITDCDITHIAPVGFYSLPLGVSSILNIFITSDKFKKREYPEY